MVIGTQPVGTPGPPDRALMSSAPVAYSGETLANAEPLCTIRRCRETDLDHILKIEKESFPDPYDRDVFTMLLGSEPGGFLVAEHDGRVVGYLVSSATYGLIFSLAVSANRRRRRIGSKLMEAALRYLRGGTDGVSLQVRVGNF